MLHILMIWRLGYLLERRRSRGCGKQGRMLICNDSNGKDSKIFWKKILSGYNFQGKMNRRYFYIVL